MYEFYLNGALLPVTPSSLTVKIANQNKTVNLINEGEYNIIKLPGLSKITFEALLPSKAYAFARYPGGFRNAGDYLTMLEDLKTGCQPFSFQVIRTDDSGSLLLNSRPMTVSLEDYEILEDAEKYGMDVMVKIALLQYREYGTKALHFQTDESRTKATVTEGRDTSTKPVETAYTVKAGDTLWDIARIHLGNGSRSGEIYTLNREAIEAAAKEHGRASSSNGWWLYPGTGLKLPS